MIHFDVFKSTPLTQHNKAGLNVCPFDSQHSFSDLNEIWYIRFRSVSDTRQYAV